MDKWDKRFLDLASHISEWSKDDSTKVGAVIAKGKRVVSLGYNGFPKDIRDIWTSRSEKLAKTIHAEENAILFAKEDLRTSIIFITHPPCSKCAAKIIQVGILAVVVNRPSEDFLSRWQDDYDLMKDMFRQASVNYTEY